jgi:glycosyltransferase involved in cell wall biosynthesis
VYYYMEEGAAVTLPPGVVAVEAGAIPEVDVMQVYNDALVRELGQSHIPRVRTHAVLHGVPRKQEDENVVFVSRTLARTYGSERYILNAVDPDEYIFSDSKQNYLLFFCGLDRARNKGLEIAIEASHRSGVPLWYGGTSSSPEVVEEYMELFRVNGVRYLGEVFGVWRAKLLAGARALLFPVQWNESFGLVIAEALMSGTPVIGSRNGACPELITPDVGFVCSSIDEYVKAVERAPEISPAACREKAMRDFHYLRMAREYADHYERVLARRNHAGSQS